MVGRRKIKIEGGSKKREGERVDREGGLDIRMEATGRRTRRRGRMRKALSPSGMGEAHSCASVASRLILADCFSEERASCCEASSLRAHSCLSDATLRSKRAVSCTSSVLNRAEESEMLL